MIHGKIRVLEIMNGALILPLEEAPSDESSFVKKNTSPLGLTLYSSKVNSRELS